NRSILRVGTENQHYIVMLIAPQSSRAIAHPTRLNAITFAHTGGAGRIHGREGAPRSILAFNLRVCAGRNRRSRKYFPNLVAYARARGDTVALALGKMVTI